jgi:DNA modification methylase
MFLRLIESDYRQVGLGTFDCVFADPPDNIKLGYDEYEDNLKTAEYRAWLRTMVFDFAALAPVVWLSFNSRWTAAVGRYVDEFLEVNKAWRLQACVQVFTFGQHNAHGLGNNHRPLWRLFHKDAPAYAEAIRVPSWRQLNGDKRANPNGRVPGDVFDMQYPIDAGTVFDFPRVTGNSKHRCAWHTTQLHPELIERCILFSTLPGDTVFDPFAGTGTTLKVCEKNARNCVTCEISSGYVAKLCEENNLTRVVDREYGREF